MSSFRSGKMRARQAAFDAANESEAEAAEKAAEATYGAMYQDVLSATVELAQECRLDMTPRLRLALAKIAESWCAHVAEAKATKA